MKQTNLFSLHLISADFASALRSSRPNAKKDAKCAKNRRGGKDVNEADEPFFCSFNLSELRVSSAFFASLWTEGRKVRRESAEGAKKLLNLRELCISSAFFAS